MIKDLFKIISNYKIEINKLENTPQKFKAIEMLDILIEKSSNDKEILHFVLNNLKQTIKLRQCLQKYAMYNEDNLIHFNAMIIIDNINAKKN